VKITQLEAVHVAIPYDHWGPPTGFAGAVWPTLDFLLVRLDTDEGLSGWGESFGFGAIPATKACLEKLVAPLLVGRELEGAAGVRPLMDSLKRPLHLYGRQGIAMYALSGVDIALWDLAGKTAGEPLHRLLAPTATSPRTELPAYASLLHYGDPADVARVTERALSEGYRLIKLHETGVAEILRAREVAGPEVPLMVDVNCAWSFDEAVAAARALRPAGLHWLEEPLWPPDGFQQLARLRDEVEVPLAAGENAATADELRRLLAAGAVDYVQPSVTKVGGVSEFEAAAADALHGGSRVAPHSPYYGPGLLATMQLFAAHPEFGAVELFYCELESHLFPEGLTKAAGGKLRLPSGPGLGADPDLQVLRRYQAS
jgi:L-alanine-DL-glutamate epimerase-like enolase superfamily enzyme